MMLQSKAEGPKRVKPDQLQNYVSINTDQMVHLQD